MVVEGPRISNEKNEVTFFIWNAQFLRLHGCWMGRKGGLQQSDQLLQRRRKMMTEMEERRWNLKHIQKAEATTFGNS